MIRSNTRDVGDRLVNSLSRGTLEKVDDTKKMQEIDVRLRHDEQQQGIEHIHPYGFTSHAKAPTTEGGKKLKAETFVMFVDGNRSHAVVLMTADRRYRITGLVEGEVAIHDDQGQSVYLKRDSILIKSPNKVRAEVGTSWWEITATKFKSFVGNLSITNTGTKIFLGKEDVEHAVLTVDGPSTKIFASVNETE